MNLLVDTHLLLWAAAGSTRLSPTARAMLEDTHNRVWFSPASLWEVGIKRGLGRADFTVDPRLLRRGLVDAGYEELPITAEHALAVDSLPPIHKDPFDRMLLAQASVEGILLITSDVTVARYPAPVRFV